MNWNLCLPFTSCCLFVLPVSVFLSLQSSFGSVCYVFPPFSFLFSAPLLHLQVVHGFQSLVVTLVIQHVHLTYPKLNLSHSCIFFLHNIEDVGRLDPFLSIQAVIFVCFNSFSKKAFEAFSRYYCCFVQFAWSVFVHVYSHAYHFLCSIFACACQTFCLGSFLLEVRHLDFSMREGPPLIKSHIFLDWKCVHSAHILWACF